MGGTWEDGGYLGLDAADTTITGPALRVKLSGDRGVVLAGIADFDDIGVSFLSGQVAGWSTTSARITVQTYKKQGTIAMTASGTIAQNGKVYRAASGKVSATQNGAAIGIALEAAADGEIIEVVPLPLATRSPVRVADPGTGAAIPVPDYDFSVALTIASAGAETNTLAIPKYQGQRCQMFVDTIGTGTRAVTVASAFNVGNNTIITFDAVRDYVELVGITVAGVLAWQNTDVSTTAFS